MAKHIYIIGDFAPSYLQCGGGASHSVVATAAHARYHQKTMGCAGTLATARRRIHAMDFAAHSREEARATIEAAKVINTKPSHYSWSPAELDVNRRSIYELKFHHSCPFRHLGSTSPI